MTSIPVTPGPCCAKRGLFNLFSCKNEGLYPCFECEQGVCDDHAVQMGADGKILCPQCYAAQSDQDDSDTSTAAGASTAFNSDDRKSVSTSRSHQESGGSSSSFRDS